MALSKALEKKLSNSSALSVPKALSISVLKYVNNVSKRDA